MKDTWYRRLATQLTPAAFGSFFVPPAKEVDLTRKVLQQSLAYADPSRLVAGWKQQPYNPGYLATRKGMAIYDQMKRDEQVKAALKFKKDSVLASGWEVVSPGDQEEAWEVTRFVRDTFMQVEGGWHTVLLNTLSALEYGFSTAEKIFSEVDHGEWKGKIKLSRVQSLRPNFIDFAADEYGTLTGLIQNNAGLGQRELPPAKFIRYTYNLEHGNYYGTSDLDSAYRAWWTKDNAYKWLAITLERYGMAPLFAMYNPNDYSGGQLEELKKIIKNIQNSTLGILPRASKDSLDLWSQDLDKGSINNFLQALDRFDQHIARALLVPSMLGVSSDDGKTGSLARSGQHAESFLQVVSQLQQDLAVTVMNAQVIPQLCDLNWPGLESYPVFRWLALTDERRLEIISTWATLVSGQIVNKIEDDEVHIRKVLGFPENESPEVLEAPKEGEEIPEEKQTAEMRLYAEEEGPGVWRTVRGRRVFIREGEDLDSALKRSLQSGEKSKKEPTHVVSVIMKDPLQVAAGSKLIFKKIRVSAGSDDEALEKARKFYRKRGFENIHTSVDKRLTPDERDETDASEKELSVSIPEEDQSVGMRQFAEENGAVWVELVDGQRVAVPAEEA